MTTKNKHNETIILTPEQEAIKRLEDKLKESEETIKSFKKLLEILKSNEGQYLSINHVFIQDFYDILSEYLSLKSYATTVVDLFKKK